MNRPILVACLCVAAVAGCTRTVVREHVVEKQPVVERETVVERPTVTRETIVAVPASCTFAGSAYANGSMSCQSGYQYLCRNGAWERAGVC